MDLINSGAQREDIAHAILLMDKIDAQRNAIVVIMNYLFELASVPLLPEITLSSRLLGASQIMDEVGLQYAWSLCYLRSHDQILRYVATPDGSPDGLQASPDENAKELGRHIEKAIAIGGLWSGIREGEATHLRRLAERLGKKILVVDTTNAVTMSKGITNPRSLDANRSSAVADRQSGIGRITYWIGRMLRFR